MRLSGPAVAVKNKAVNFTTALRPVNVGTVTYYWWFDNKTEVRFPLTPPRCPINVSDRFHTLPLWPFSLCSAWLEGRPSPSPGKEVTWSPCRLPSGTRSSRTTRRWRFMVNSFVFYFFFFSRHGDRENISTAYSMFKVTSELVVKKGTKPWAGLFNDGYLKTNSAAIHVHIT